MNSHAAARGQNMGFKLPPVFHRPQFDSLSAISRNMMNNAAAELQEMSPTRLSDWDAILRTTSDPFLTQLLDRLRPALADPLCAVYSEYHCLSINEPVLGVEIHSPDELALFPHFVEQLNSAVLADKDEQAFIRCLEETSSTLLRTNSKIRKGPVYLAADSRGRYVEYVDHTDIQGHLEYLFFLLIRDDVPVVFRATVAYVIFVGAHPFLDGNGRVARLLFSGVLAQSGLSLQSYIPLKEIFSLTRGAVSIRTRRALFHNDWDAVVQCLSAAIELTSCLNSHLAQPAKASSEFQ